MQTFISCFRDMNIGKLEPWDGEDEAVFKTCLEKLSAHMVGTADKVWKKVIKYIAEMDEDDNLSRQRKDIENMMIDSKINPDLTDEMQDMLYEQLTQHQERASCSRSNGWTSTESGVLAVGDGVQQKEDGREPTSCPESGDVTRDGRNHGPTGRKMPKLEKGHCVLEGHRRLRFQRPDDALDPRGLGAR